jgi:glycosyltransferase involved in cell wall biosynthesis
MSQKSSFTVVIPCYNEEKAIPAFLTELNSFIDLFLINFPLFKLNVLIIDNNSTDQSFQILNAANLKPEIQVLQCQVQGYGAALKFGFLNSKSDYYSFADLDNTYPLSDLVVMLKLMQFKKSDMVLGSRLHLRSEIEFLRLLGNKVYLKITNFLFSAQITDSCSGMRIFSEQVKKDVLSLTQNDLSFSIELTAKALSKKWVIAEYPIAYRHRLGESKLSLFADGFKFLFVLMRVRFFG